MAIDIGPGAVDRASNFDPGYTVLDKANPANATGTIDTVELWFESDATNVQVGTFYGSDFTYSCRDYTTIGSVTAGSKQTFTGLSIDVQTGDIIGVYFEGGYIERDTTGGVEILFKAGNQMGTTDITYSNDLDDAISIYGTGVEAVVGQILAHRKIW